MKSLGIEQCVALSGWLTYTSYLTSLRLNHAYIYWLTLLFIDHLVCTSGMGLSESWGDYGGKNQGLSFFHGIYNLFICKKAYWELPSGPDDTTVIAESEEELRSLLMKVKEESEKPGLKLNIQKEIMASSPIISWQIDRETMETVTDFIFLGSKITTDDDCSHEVKRRLLLARKAVTNLTVY